jgi:Replication factor A protein 3
MTDQPDGSYPRLNGSLLQTGRFSNQIVSLLGKVIMFDGSTIKLHCADGVIAIVKCEPDAEVQQGYIYELVGHANEDNTLQVSYLYVSSIENVKPNRYSTKAFLSHKRSYSFPDCFQ